MKFGLLLVPALAFSLLPPVARAQEPAKPQESARRDTASLLFESPAWSKAPAGTKIVYAYSRKTYGTAEFGEQFDDKVTMTVAPGDDAASRKAEVELFSGAHRRPAGPFETSTTNPILLLIFEDNIQQFGHIFKGNPLYLKSAIRKAWRDNAKIEDVTLTVGGKSVPGTRITIQPFLNDAMKDHMKGLEGMIYRVDISDRVPGELVAIDIHAPADGTPRFSETLVYSGEPAP